MYSGYRQWVEMSLDPAGRVPAPQELERFVTVVLDILRLVQ
jgi:hypothetical protein